MSVTEKGMPLYEADGQAQIGTESLSRRVLTGGIWVFSLRAVSRGLGFLRTIILARLLVPEDFGLLGIAILTISTLETFSQTGIQTALVQKKDSVESYLDTAWTVSVIRGALLFLILFFSAPVVAGFFDSPQSSLVIKVLAVSTLITALRNPGVLHFQREMEFNKQFLLSIATTLTNLAVSVSLAFLLRNVWSLVWGGLAGSFVGAILSYILHPYRPRVRFDKEKYRELFGFGKWVVGSSMLIFLVTQGDDIFVGKVLGVTALGLYQMAYLISNLPATEITHVISQVTYPAYSKLQDDLQRVGDAYLRVVQLVAFLSFPVAGLLFVFSKEAIEIFLTDKWIGIVPALKVMALAGVARSIAASAGPVFHGIGQPKTETFWQVIRLAVLAIFIYPLTHTWGTAGTATAVTISYAAATVKTRVIIKICQCSLKRFLTVLALPGAATIIAVSAGHALKWVFASIGLVQLIILTNASLFLYLSIAYLIDHVSDYRILEALKSLYGSITDRR